MDCPYCHVAISPTEINSAIMYDHCYLLCRNCFHILYWAGKGLQVIGDNELLYLEEHDAHRLHEIVDAICGHMRRIANERPKRPMGR